MVVLLMVVTVYISTVMTNRRVERSQNDEAQALYLAEAGINKAIYYLNNTAPDGSMNGSWSTSAYPQTVVNAPVGSPIPGTTPYSSWPACSSNYPCQEPLYLSGGTYTFGVYPAPANNSVAGTYTLWVTQGQACGSATCIQITSQGTFDNVSRIVEVWVSNFNVTNGLVAWWKLNDGSGSSAADSSGNGYTGTLKNNPSWVSSSTWPWPYALSLTAASSQDMTMGNIALTNNLQAATWSAWIYVPTLPFTGNAEIISKWDNVNQDQFTLRVNTSGEVCAYIASAVTDLGSNYGCTSSPVITAQNTWYHVVAVYGTQTVNSNILNFYINGNLMPVTLIGNVSGSLPSSLTVPTSPYDIGAYGTIGSTANDFFNGTIDDVRIYNRALTGNEVQMLYNYTYPSLSVVPGSWQECSPANPTTCW